MMLALIIPSFIFWCHTDNATSHPFLALIKKWHILLLKTSIFLFMFMCSNLANTFIMTNNQFYIYM